MSEQAKPTPGPWKPIRGVDEDETRWIVVSASGGNEWHIATIENGQPGDSLETETATGHLIAAAPDLYEACKAFVERFNWDLTPEQAEAWDAAMDAIRKAEGRQP